MADAPAAPVNTNGVHTQDKAAEETVGIKIFAGNLAYSVNDEGLKAFFAPVQSDILSAQVIYRGTRSAGYGFVALATEAAAQKAIELLNKKEFEGRPIIVEIAKPAEQKEKDASERKAKRRVGRRGSKAVPGEVTEAEANGEVEKPSTADEAAGKEGKPKKKKQPRKRKSKAHAAEGAAASGEGAAHVEGGAVTSGEEGAAKKRTPKPRRARLARPAGEDPAGEPSKTMLFVANLSFSLEDDGLAKLFTDAGIKVVTARVVRRRWGNPRKSKGYGFVDVGNEEEQQKAIAALQGKELEGGRQIAVKVAVNTAEHDEHDEHGDEKEGGVKEGGEKEGGEKVNEATPAA